MSNGFFYEIHDDGKAPSWAFHFHEHLSSRPAVDLLHVEKELNLGLSMIMGIS